MLRPCIREILERTRRARLALDAVLGIVPSRIEKFMSNTNDNGLGVSLTDDDLTFLQHAHGLESAFKKLQQAKQLIVEARREIAQVLVGGELPTSTARKTSKKAKAKAKAKPPAVNFAVDLPEELTEGEQSVLAALKKLKTAKTAELIAKTGQTTYIVKRAARTLKKRGLIGLEGRGPGAHWTAA